MALTIDISKDYFYRQGAEARIVKIAMEMLKKGLDKPLVAEITSLGLTDIEKLEKQLNNKKK
jgi:uncharacterized protein HemY